MDDPALLEQMATDDIVNDWVDDHVFTDEHFDDGYYVTATIMLFVSITARGKTEMGAIANLKLALLERHSTRHNIAIDWLYSSLDLLPK